MAWRLSWRKPERLCSFGDKKARGKDQKGKVMKKNEGKKRVLDKAAVAKVLEKYALQ